jgi:short-subunit dehydrogenase
MDAETRPVALVTGASSGIGRAFARRLARDGNDLILVARRKERLSELADEIADNGAAAEIIVADLSGQNGLAPVEQRAARGDISILVNNAGFQKYMPFADLDPDIAEQQIFLHVTAPVRLCRAVLPGMLSRSKGSIVNVSSMLSFSAGLDQPFLPKRATYAASKAFVTAFSEILATEVRDSGINVQALCPGVVRTEFHDVDGRPQRRPGVPVMEAEDVVQASLAGLALGEIVCSPGLANQNLLENVSKARQTLLGSALSAELAPRYAGK